MKDMNSGVRVATLLPAATYAADNTPATVDTLGFQSALVLLAIGVGGITFTGVNRVDFVLSHSDDDATYTPVTTADMIGVTIASGGIIRSLIAAHAAGASYRYGYKGGRRYLRLLADFSGTHATGTPMAGTLLLGDPEVAPVANQA